MILISSTQHPLSRIATISSDLCETQDESSGGLGEAATVTSPTLDADVTNIRCRAIDYFYYVYIKNSASCKLGSKSHFATKVVSLLRPNNVGYCNMEVTETFSQFANLSIPLAQWRISD